MFLLTLDRSNSLTHSRNKHDSQSVCMLTHQSTQSFSMKRHCLGYRLRMWMQTWLSPWKSDSLLYFLCRCLLAKWRWTNGLCYSHTDSGQICNFRAEPSVKDINQILGYILLGSRTKGSLPEHTTKRRQCNHCIKHRRRKKNYRGADKPITKWLQNTNELKFWKNLSKI